MDKEASGARQAAFAKVRAEIQLPVFRSRSNVQIAVIGPDAAEVGFVRIGVIPLTGMLRCQ
ncbi:MAG: hypothetical protein OEN23_03380 [Paracoccaceae bacterium]|nr:hypothetical protein [Paracoccaceae bacterium]